MPTVIHIEGGLNAEPGTFSIKPGESLKDVLDSWGVIWTAEDVRAVPAPPRKLAPDVVEFIASYEYEDPPAVLAVVRRYGWLDSEEFDTAEEARSFIESGEDWGSLAGEAVVDGDQITVWD